MRSPPPDLRLSAVAGPLAAALERCRERLRDQRVVERLWERDAGLWPSDAGEAGERLGWLRGAEHPGLDLENLRALAAEVRQAGFREAVLLGMGGSSLGAATLTGLLPGTGGLDLTVLDSTAPGWIRRVAARAGEIPTLFVVASRSGTTTEVACLADFFWARVEERQGSARPGEAFLAITDAGSPLAARSVERGFRRLLEAPSDVGGRFSVLTPFGLAPAALAGRPLAAVAAGAAAMAAACRAAEPEANPGAELGALLAAAALTGRDKLVLASPPGLSPFAAWVEQLVAESTGKLGRGLLPVRDEPDVPPERLRDDRLTVLLGAGQQMDESELQRLAAAGRPAVGLAIDGAEALGGELFRWMFAVAVAGHLLEVDPFDQPDVEARKRETARLLGALSGEVASPAGTEPAPDPAALAAALADASYLAIGAFASPDPALEAAVAGLRQRVAGRTGLAATFAYGPRFLHSTGQLHKGGPPGGVHLQLRAAEPELAIPDRPYGFAALLRVQATGDALALRERGRPVFVVELGAEGAAAVERFAAGLDAALPGRTA